MSRPTNYARMAGPGDCWTPPDDLPYIDCPTCDGRKKIRVLHDVTHQLGTDSLEFDDECPACEGLGKVDAETGEPYDLRAIERMAEDRG